MAHREPIAPPDCRGQATNLDCKVIIASYSSTDTRIGFQRASQILKTQLYLLILVTRNRLIRGFGSSLAIQIPRRGIGFIVLYNEDPAIWCFNFFDQQALRHAELKFAVRLNWRLSTIGDRAW